MGFGTLKAILLRLARDYLEDSNPNTGSMCHRIGDRHAFEVSTEGLGLDGGSESRANGPGAGNKFVVF
jgi:hypothetical protein